MTPLRFEIVGTDYGLEDKIHVSVIQQFKQHYTKETIYRVRLEGEVGWVTEQIWTDSKMKHMLAARISATD